MKLSNTSTRLKEIMSSENLRQVDILEKCIPYSKKYGTKISKVDLSQYVSGKVEPGQAKLFVLANALNVNEAWLMGYDVIKERGKPIITNHQNLSDDVLYAIHILAEASGFTFKIFAKQYEICFNDCTVKLSPNEVEDYVKSSIDSIRYVTECIINNKFRDDITPINKDYFVPMAAHNDFSDKEGQLELMQQDLDEL